MSTTRFSQSAQITLLFVLFWLTIGRISPCYGQNSIHSKIPDNERTALTITEEDFQHLLQERAKGLAGFHKNIDPQLVIPAPDHAVFNWTDLPEHERARLVKKQEEMFHQGKITLIVLAGGEATRFGGPKTFVKVSSELGDFLEIKAANLNWMRKTYGAQVPLYILSSEKRLEKFKASLAERFYYGLKPEDFRWYVQGTVDSFIPTDEELQAHFQGEELKKHLGYAQAIRQANPDGIYRFKGERRKVPPGHFDAIGSFIISGLLSEALALGIKFASIVNIDNLQALLKNDGMIAFFAERGDDFGFILAEKNLTFTITHQLTGKMIHPKLIARFRDEVISFDGINEFEGSAEKEGYLFVLNQKKKSIDVFDASSGFPIPTHVKVKPEIGGTLVQPINEKGEHIGKPVMKEGFELPHHFDHAHAALFNTNTMILNLKSLLKFLEISEEQLARLNFEERSILVREKLMRQIRTYFEFKNHEVEGEYPQFGVVKDRRTKIPVSQVTRILIQATHLKEAKTGYLFAPRRTVFAPVKEPEDKQSAAELHKDAIMRYTNYEQIPYRG